LVDFKDFVLGAAGTVGGGVQIARYIKDWLAFHAWDVSGCPDDAPGTHGRPMRDEVGEPFFQWLQARDLDVVARFAMRSMTIMGYGALDRVPALYGLRWNMPTLLWSAVAHKVVEPVPGWQHLWTHVAGPLDVRLGQRIATVERRADGFEVRTETEALAFDHLVLTGPLDEAAAWFPFSADERADYAVDTGALGWHEYATTLVHAEGWFRDADTRSFEAHAQDSAAVARGQLLVARRTGDKTPVAAARSASRPDVYVCYQPGDPARTNAEMLDILRADLAADGGTIREVLAQCRWKYAPQLTTAAIQGGAAARFERQQGAGNLWVTGATASHEAVDNIVDHNERLVDRMERAFAGKHPSDDDAFAEQAQRHRFDTNEM
jgi:hypothetical protein